MTMQPLHFNTLDDSHPIRDLLAMIERRAPEFIRSGGGALRGENTRNPGFTGLRRSQPLTPQEIAHARELRAGGARLMDIAAQIHRRTSTVGRILRERAD